MIQELHRKMTQASDNLRMRIAEYNADKLGEAIVTEEFVFKSIMDNDLPIELKNQILFWKSIEQIVLSSQSLTRMITNLDAMANFNLSSAKYEGLRDEYEEYLNVRIIKFLKIRNDAENLFKNIELMFEPEILEKISQVTKSLNKQ